MSARFDIGFTGKSWQDDGIPFESVKLTLGGAEAYEAADLSHWSHEEYHQQWLSELRSIARSTDKGALIVSIHEPTRGYRIWIWSMWKHADEVRFQTRLLFMSEVARGFHVSRISDFIGDYAAQSEAGEAISEWTVPLTAIQEFLATQALA